MTGEGKQDKEPDDREHTEPDSGYWLLSRSMYGQYKKLMHELTIEDN